MEEAKKLIEKHYNIIERFVDYNYCDMLAKELAINHCDLMIEDAQFDEYNGRERIKYWKQLKEVINQL